MCFLPGRGRPGYATYGSILRVFSLSRKYLRRFRRCTGEAVIIDPGCYEQAEKEALRHYIETNKLNVKYLLLTHSHLDHVFGGGLREAYVWRKSVSARVGSSHFIPMYQRAVPCTAFVDTSHPILMSTSKKENSLGLAIPF